MQMIMMNVKMIVMKNVGKLVLLQKKQVRVKRRKDVEEDK
jgi:hypothetical protein